MYGIPVSPVQIFGNDELIGFFYPISSNSNVQYYQGLKSQKVYKRMRTSTGDWSEWFELEG